MNIMNKKIFANKALLPDGWASNVLIEIDNSGIISKIIENFDRDEKGFDLDEDIIIGNHYFIIFEGNDNLISLIEKTTFSGSFPRAAMALCRIFPLEFLTPEAPRVPALGFSTQRADWGPSL